MRRTKVSLLSIRRTVPASVRLEHAGGVVELLGKVVAFTTVRAMLDAFLYTPPLSLPRLAQHVFGRFSF